MRYIAIAAAAVCLIISMFLFFFSMLMSSWASDGYSVVPSGEYQGVNTDVSAPAFLIGMGLACLGAIILLITDGWKPRGGR